MSHLKARKIGTNAAINGKTEDELVASLSGKAWNVIAWARTSFREQMAKA